MTAQQAFRNVLILIGTLLVAYIMYRSLRVLIVLSVGIIVASALRPAMLWLQKRKFPRFAAIGVIYIALILVLFILGLVILPPIINQLAVYVRGEANVIEQIVSAQQQIESFIEGRFGIDVTFPSREAVESTLADIAEELRTRVPALAGNFGGLFSELILVFVIAAYWLVSRDRTIAFLKTLLTPSQREKADQIIPEVERGLGGYVTGVVFVGFFVGVANFILMSLLRVNNAPLLAFIIGTTTTIPIIGGYIGGIAAMVIALINSPNDAVWAMISFLLIQQVENYYLTPRIMSQTISLNPILTIITLLIGFAIGGIAGGMIAVPLAGALQVILFHLYIKPRQEQVALAEVRPVATS